MKFIRIAIIVSLMWASLSSPGWAQASDISEKLARLRQTLTTIQLSEEDAKSYASRLKQAEDALAAGYLFLSLYQMQSAWVRLNAQASQLSKAEIAKQGNQVYEREWQRFDHERASKEKLFTPAAARSLPASVTALLQVSRWQSRPYAQSGKLYGYNTSLDFGYYYMGLAEGNIEFALFCQQLRFSQPRTPVRFASLGGALSELEKTTIAAYGQAGGKDQPRYIEINSTLKLASELQQAGWREGAWHKYLEAQMLFGLLTMAAPAPDEQAKVKAELATADARFKADPRDHSIGLLYLQLAQMAMAEKEKNGDELKRAAVIARQVLPRYFQQIAEVKR